MAYLGIIDYIVLIAVLSVSLGIGIFFGKKKQDSREYTSGKGKLGVIPVGLSMTVSFISAITIQGTPAEVYLYGPEFMLTVFSSWGCVLAAFTFVPLYCSLNIESVFTYLEVRFNNKALLLMSYIFGIVLPMTYMGVTTFGPAAALESVTGIPTWINVFTMMAICTVYTSIGGIKAVVWTDAFQALVMVFGLIAIILTNQNKSITSPVAFTIPLFDIQGLFQLQDETSVWDELHKRSRLNFHFSPDPRLRINIWILTLGKGIQWLSYFSLQPSLMRYRAVGTEARAMKVVALSSFGFVLLMTLSGFAGIVVYAYYSHIGCGPLGSGNVYSSNQVISYFVADVLNFPGLPGLFIAALIAATFSSISSAQNAITATLWQDILDPYVKGIGDRTKTFLMKVTVVVFGLLSTAVAFLSKYMGGSLAQVSATLLSVFGGPVFGLYITGGIFPFVGGTSALIATLFSCSVCSWLAVGNILYGNTWERPILIDDNCGLNATFVSGSFLGNETTALPLIRSDEQNTWKEIFSISPFLYSIIGVGLTIMVSSILSIIPRLRPQKLDPTLYFPFVSNLLTRTASQETVKLDESLVGTRLSQSSNKKNSFDLTFRNEDTRENRGLLTDLPLKVEICQQGSSYQY